MGNLGKLDQRPAWTIEQISGALGEPATRLITTIAEHAHAQKRSIYLAGGVVRDLLLGRENLDLDFVLEGDAITFANTLARIYGGETERHIHFGTAKWTLDNAAIDHFALGSGKIPAAIDFATARTEEYLAPAALPKVKPGTISQDLQRRDFTINALALRIAAGTGAWQLLDPANGYSDILNKKIRILHDRSFIDDPTRIFRAFRFARRFAFAIESRAAEILSEAIPVIQRLSGARIRHELDLILREKYPERMIADLDALDIFSQIHNSFSISAQSTDHFKRLREHKHKIPWDADDISQLRWHLLFFGITEDDALSISARLDLTQKLSNSIVGFARLQAKIDWLGAPASKASAITRFLDDIPQTALRAGLVSNFNERSAKQRLESYMADWRYRRSTIDGNELIRAGLPPGPIYREILEGLRSAWIDGEIDSEHQERELLLKMLEDAE